jgi:hypothetical protein
MLVQVAWAVLGVVIIGGALLAHRSRTAYRAAIGALALLYLPAGAAAHAWNLATDVSYSGFADWSWSSFVTDTWESLVVPHDWIFIGLLVAFEATVGVLVLFAGRPRRIALVLILAFHVALVSFGWAYLVWVLPMTAALVLLLRAERWEDRLDAPGPALHPQHA